MVKVKEFHLGGTEMSGKIIHKIAAAGAGVLVAASSCATVSAFGHSYYLPEAAEICLP